MEVQNILGSNLLFIVKCRDEKEAAKLIKRAKSVYADLGSCCICKHSYHIPPPPPQSAIRPEAAGEALGRHIRGELLFGEASISADAGAFIRRILKDGGTEAELSILPAVLDFYLRLKRDAS